MKQNELILRIAKELDNNLIEYIKIDKLARKLGHNWSTTKQHTEMIVKELGCLKLQQMPNNFEDFEEENKLISILNRMELEGTLLYAKTDFLKGQKQGELMMLRKIKDILSNKSRRE